MGSLHPKVLVIGRGLFPSIFLVVVVEWGVLSAQDWPNFPCTIQVPVDHGYQTTITHQVNTSNSAETC